MGEFPINFVESFYVEKLFLWKRSYGYEVKIVQTPIFGG